METLLIILIAYFSLAILYTLIMTVISFYYSDNKILNKSKEYSYSIVIPAYKEDEVIVETAYSALRQLYNKELFRVYVIADQLKNETIALLKELNIELIIVSFEKSTKVKSLRAYAEQFGLQSDYTILLDADNCIEPTFIKELNIKLNINQSNVVQLQRKSKNHDTGISFLDAFSEYANTSILCKGPNMLKLSSKLSGSGMILRSDIFTKLISTMNGISGFDKEMELKLTKEKVFINYFDAPYVLDEKLVSASQIKTQRSRWIYAQFDYFRKFFKSGIIALFNGNLDHAHKVFQLALPPRVLGVILLVIINALTFITSTNTSLIYTLGVMDVLFITSYTLLFIEFNKNHRVPKGILIEIYKVFVGYLLTIKYFKRAGKEFLHTKHNI